MGGVWKTRACVKKFGLPRSFARSGQKGGPIWVVSEGQPHFSPFFFGCLTEFTSSPHTILLAMWGIRDWRSYAPTMGYHESQNG